MSKESDWIDEQLAAVDLTSTGKSVVRNLLHTLQTAIRVQDPASEQEISRAVEVFVKLSKGQSVTHLAKKEKAQNWTQVRPGGIVMRQTVRVKSDAYDGDFGKSHNGRVGVVVGIRPDDIRVKYTDGKEPSPDYVRHRTSALEKRIK